MEQTSTNKTNRKPPVQTSANKKAEATKRVGGVRADSRASE